MEEDEDRDVTESFDGEVRDSNAPLCPLIWLFGMPDSSLSGKNLLARAHSAF